MRPSRLEIVLKNILTGVFLLAGTGLGPGAEAAQTAYGARLKQAEDHLASIKMELLQHYRNIEAAGEAAKENTGDRPESSTIPSEANLAGLAALWKQVEEASDRGISRDPQSAQTRDERRLLLVHRLLQARMTGQAEKVLKEIVSESRREPITSEAWFRLEKLHYNAGEYQKALEAYFKISGKARSALRQEAAYLAGNSYLYLRENLKAIDILSKFSEASEYYPFAVYSSGLAYLNLGDAWSSTQLEFQKLISFIPGEDPVLKELVNKTRVTLGFFFIDLKRFQEAMAVFKAVPPNSRFWPQAQLGVGRSFIGQEDCVKAIVALRDLIERAPLHSYALEARLDAGNCYSKLSAHRKAVDSYQDALKIFSDRHDALRRQVGELQGSSLETWISRRPAVSAGTDPSPAFAQPDFVLERDRPELLDLYEDWQGVYREVRRVEAGDQGPSGEEGAGGTRGSLSRLQERLQAVRKQMEELFREGLTDHFSRKMDEVDGLAIRANIGFAKNMALMIGPGL